MEILVKLARSKIYLFARLCFFQSGYLDVVVPPDILNHPTNNLEEGVSTEGGSIALECSAIGVPVPKVQWRREAGKDIILRGDSREKQGTINIVNFSYIPLVA